MDPKILVFDIETAPNKGYTWEKYEQNVLSFVEPWYMLCFAYKWLGDKQTKAFSLPDFKGYNHVKPNDKQLVTELWKLFNEADIIIAHNGDAFDIKKSNARFLEHGMKAPSNYRTVDTLKVAKKHFKMTSNKLDDIGQVLGVGRKLRTGGFDLWLDCMAGDMKAWKRMVAYSKQDVILLEEVYNKLLPWMNNHPNRNVYTDENGCPACGHENMTANGFRYTQGTKYRRLQCQGCGAWAKGSLTGRGFITP